MKNILDIIIPSYNDELSLYNTLMSIGSLVENIQVTIIDDASTKIIDYEKIQSFFSTFFPITILKNDINLGAERTRQIALERTNNSYILFIDCGDVIISSGTLKYYIEILNNNPQIDIILPSCFFEVPPNNELNFYGWMNNKLDGKIYRRSFIEKNKIRFCSYFNGDIIFTMECKIVSAFLYDNKNLYCSDTNPLIISTYNRNSITKRNGEIAIFKDQNYGAGRGEDFLITELQKNLNIPLEYFVNDIRECFLYMYITYLNCITEYHECSEVAFKDALWFYHKYKKIILNERLMQQFNKIIDQAYKEHEPFTNFNIKLDIEDFIRQLDEKENKCYN